MALGRGSTQIRASGSGGRGSGGEGLGGYSSTLGPRRISGPSRPKWLPARTLIWIVVTETIRVGPASQAARDKPPGGRAGTAAPPIREATGLPPWHEPDPEIWHRHQGFPPRPTDRRPVVLGRFEARPRGPGPPGVSGQTRAAPRNRRTRGPGFTMILGCSLTIRSHAVRGRASPAPCRTESHARVRSAPGLGFARRGGLGSVGAGSRVRSAPGIGFARRIGPPPRTPSRGSN
jgi:hypothetical protein